MVMVFTPLRTEISWDFLPLDFRWTFVNNFQLWTKDFDFAVEIYSHVGTDSEPSIPAKNRNGFIDRTNSLQTPYWTPDNQIDNDYARLFSSDGSASFNVYQQQFSFVRLQNLTLSYTST